MASAEEKKKKNQRDGMDAWSVVVTVVVAEWK